MLLSYLYQSRLRQSAFLPYTSSKPYFHEISQIITDDLEKLKGNLDEEDRKRSERKRQTAARRRRQNLEPKVKRVINVDDEIDEHPRMTKKEFIKKRS